MNRKFIIAFICLGAISAIAGAGAVGLAAGRSTYGVPAASPPSVSTVGVGHLSEARTSMRFPGKGTDAFESLAEVSIVPNDPACATGTGVGAREVRLGGPTVVQRSSPKGGKQDYINTEIIAMELVGIEPQLGNVVVKESQTQKSTGRVTQIGRDGSSDRRDLPAKSFFDIFVEVTVQGQTLHNNTAVHMQNDAIRSIPPIGSQYQSTPKPVALFTAANAPTSFCIIHARHVPEDASHVILFRELLLLEAKLDNLCQTHAAMPGCNV